MDYMLLIEVLEAGNIAEANRLLDKNPKYIKQSVLRHNELMTAAIKGKNVDCITRLMKEKDIYNATVEKCREVLYSTAQSGSVPIMKLFLAELKGRETAVSNSADLFEAALDCEHDSMVEYLLTIPGFSKALIALERSFFVSLKNRVAGKGNLFVLNLLLALPGSSEFAARTAPISSRVTTADLRAAGLDGIIFDVHGPREDAMRAAQEKLKKEKGVSGGDSALSEAAAHGHILVVNRLLEIPTVRATLPENEHFILNKAIEAKHFDVVYCLLKAYKQTGQPFPALKCGGANLEDFYISRELTAASSSYYTPSYATSTSLSSSSVSTLSSSSATSTLSASSSTSSGSVPSSLALSTDQVRP